MSSQGGLSSSSWLSFSRRSHMTLVNFPFPWAQAHQFLQEALASKRRWTMAADTAYSGRAAAASRSPFPPRAESNDDVVQCHSQAPHVLCGSFTVCAQEAFWASKREAATHSTQLAATELAAQSKVHNFDLPLCVEKHVLWFQVPVDDALQVAALH